MNGILSIILNKKKLFFACVNLTRFADDFFRSSRGPTFADWTFSNISRMPKFSYVNFI